MKKQQNIAAAICLSIFLSIIVGGLVYALTLSEAGKGRTYSYLSGTMDSIEVSSAPITLTNETAYVYETDVYIVDNCLATFATNAITTPAHYVKCYYSDQSVAANRGLVTFQNDTIGGTTSGTTTINFRISGYGLQ